MNKCQHIRWLWILLPVLLVTGSCKKNFLPDQSGDDKLVILSEATAGDLVRIPIGKTIRAGGGNLVKFEKVNDATVVLSEDRGGKWLLKADKSQQFAANPTSVFTFRHYFRHNTKYTVEITHPVLGTARAVTSIPAPVKIPHIDTATEMRLGKPVLTVKMIIKDSLDHGDFYIIEAVKQLINLRRYFYFNGTRYDFDTPQGAAKYEEVKNNPGVKLLRDTLPQQKFLRLNLFCTDGNIDNVRFDNPDNPLRRIFLPDATFDGESYLLKFSIDKELFVTPAANQKGRVLLQVKLASKDLYRYLLTYEKYKTDFGSIPANQLSSPVGNVQNGLGVFGGSSQRERVYYFDELK